MKALPQALEIEQAVLGAVLLQRDVLTDVADLLTPEMFYEPKHRTIYAACLEMAQVGTGIDILTLTQHLRKAGKTEASGGPVYLTQLTSRVASAANVHVHVKLLAEKWMQRELIVLSGKIAEQAHGEVDPFELLATIDKDLLAISRISDVGKTVEHGTALRSMLAMMQEIAAGRKAPAMPLGFAKVDEALGGGTRAGDLVVIAARPAMGKSAFAVTVARNVAEQQWPVFFATLEMSTEQQVQRVVSATSNVQLNRIRSPQFLQRQDWDAVLRAIEATQALPITWDDTPALAMPQLRAKALRWARRAKVKEGCGLIIVDYLQLMTGEQVKGGNREAEISSISRGLKQLGREIGISVIALAQLNREVEKRGGDKKPHLSDLRDSGAIEQDADVVAFLYRPEVYGIEATAEGESTKQLAYFLLGKSRNGDLGDTKLTFHGPYATFVDGEPAPNPPPF
jgi:replicative DNA helicase